MTWLQILLLLACPLMMILCMRGMHGGHKSTDKSNTISRDELQKVQIQLGTLIEENHNLKKEIESLKENNQ